MAGYSLSRQAAADLDDIVRYSIETFGLEQAEPYYLGLKDCLQRIADDPRLGRPLAGRTRIFDRYNCQRHALFYALSQHGPIIVRALHLKMEFVRHRPE